MENNSKPVKKTMRNLVVFLVILAMVISSIGFIYGNMHQEDNLIPFGAGTTLVPTGVNNTLNITFSDVTYSTVAPAMEFERGSYDGNAIWTTNANVNTTNATYLVMQQKTSTAGLAQVEYNLTSFTGRTYFFMETKIAGNFSTGSGMSIVLSDKSVSNYLSSAAKPSTIGQIVINIAGSSTGTGTLTATANTTGTATNATTNPTGTTFKSGSPAMPSLTSLQFYDLSVYAYNDSGKTAVTVALIDPTDGAVIGEVYNTDLANVNYTKLNYTAFQFDSTSALSAMVLDWGYFVFHGTSALATSDVANSVDPFVAGASNNVIMNNVAPFDPASVTNQTYKQAPNATYIHTNTVAGVNDFNNQTVLSNQTASYTSAGVNTTYATFGNVSGKLNYNATGINMVSNLSINQENTSSFTGDIHIATFNSTGINTAINNFLKNYTANLATVNTGIAYTWKNMSIISYMVSNVQTITNLSAQDASTVRDYFDNAMASVLADTNLSLVDQNTSAIIAGAFAGDFYFDGMALVPEIYHNGEIANPQTQQVYANLSDAGFASGAYISGGAVIVPQYTIVGWDAGSPIFASAGFSLGSIFGSLTSAGQAVANYMSSGVKDVSNAIGKTASTVISDAKSGANDIIKPISHDISYALPPKTISNDINQFKSDISTVASKVAPVIGTVSNDVQKDVSGAIGPISGSVKDLSSSLASVKNSLVTAVASGASGLKSNIFTLGTDIKNGTQGIINTLGNKIDSSDAVLSSMFTAIKSLPGQITSGLTSVATKLKTSLLSSIDTVGSTVVKSAGSIESSVTNAFGQVGKDVVGVTGKISSGAKTAFSFITSFGAKLGYVLEIVGITIFVVVVIALVIFFYMKYSPGGIVAGEAKHI